MPNAQSKRTLTDKLAKTAAQGRHWDAKLSGFFLQAGKSTRTWYVEHRGRRTRLGSFPDMGAADARTKATKTIADAQQTRDLAPTLQEALSSYLARERLRSEHNRRAVEAQIQTHMSTLLKRRLDTIKKKDVLALHRAIAEPRDAIDSLGRPCTIGGRRAANHTLKSFTVIWNHARKTSDFELGPCPTEAIEYFPEDASKDIIDDLDAWREQVNLLDPMHRQFYRLLLSTGMRKTECLSLTWSQVLDDRIHLPETKNGRAFDIPLESEHNVVLDPLRATRRNDVDWVFWSRRGDGHLKQPHKIGWDCQAHRRTFATVGDEVGLAPWQVGRLMNHTLPGVTAAHYIKTEVDHYRPFMRPVLDHLAPYLGLTPPTASA